MLATSLSAPLLLTFGSLFLGILSVWFKPLIIAKRQVPVWSVFFASGLVLGLGFGYVEIIGVIALLVLAAIAWFTTITVTQGKALYQVPLYVLLALGFVAIGLHVIPGFNNVLMLEPTLIGNATLEFKQYLNFDKTAGGLILLALVADKIRDKSELLHTLKISSLMIPLMLVATFGLALLLGADFDVKWLTYTPIFLIINLFATCVAEEAFFRSVIHRPMLNHLRFKAGAWLASILSALIFTALHIGGQPDLISFLAVVFVAGLFYALVYQFTRKVEAAILAHFVLNAVHFVLIVYPLSF